MIATSDFLTALECTKFDFGRGSARNGDPTGGAYSAPPDLLAGLRGAYREEKERHGKKGRRRRGRGRGGTGDEGIKGKG